MYYKEFFLLFLKLSQFVADASVIPTGGNKTISEIVSISE